jgi:putative inorganic carbon (HCO3(-)) transporter
LSIFRAGKEGKALNKNKGTFLNEPGTLVLDSSVIKRQLDALSRPENMHKAVEIIAPIGVGLALGTVLLFARGLPSDWAGLVILAAIAPTVALLVNDTRKLLLIVLVVDIPLGLDIALLGRLGHRGGPPGFLISLMTMALAVGYASWLANRPVGGKRRTYFHKSIAIPALAYLFFMLVSAIQAIEVQFSVFGIFLQIQFLLMYFYISNHVKTWADVRLILTTLVVCVILESSLMLLQYYTGFELSALGIQSQAGGSDIASATARIGGTLGPSNVAATYLATSLAITFAAYLTDGRLVNKKLALIAFFPGIAALVMTQSRSGWVAFAAALLILIALTMKRRIGVKAILLLFIVVVVLGAGFFTQIMDRFITDDHQSAESRAWYNQLALNVITDHMFTGIGVNNMRFVMDDSDYVPLELMGRSRTLIHNKYLSTWMEIGLFGFLAFIWLLLAAGRCAFQALMRAKDAHISVAITGLLAALVAYSMHMTTATFTGRARIQTLWFILALITATSRIAKKTEGVKDPILQSKLKNGQADRIGAQYPDSFHPLKES